MPAPADLPTRVRAFASPLASAFTVRVRAILSLGMVLGLGAVGTFAFWADSAAATSGTFGTGTVDLRVDNVETYSFTGLTSTNMLPGESRAATLQVQNTRSTMDVRYTMAASTDPGSPALAGHIEIQVYPGGTAGNATTNGMRKGTCTGTRLVTARLTPGASVGVITTSRPLAATTGVDPLCFVATLLTSAPIAVQNQNVPTVVFTFNAQTTV